jgi:hypothetical protein
MAEKRVAKEITKQEEIDYILSLSPLDMMKTSVVTELFGEFDGKRRYNPYDIITIPAGTYSLGDHKNKKPFRTTLGLWFFNRGMLEEDFGGILGYINRPITKKMYGKIQSELSYALLEDDITIDQLKLYLQKTQKYQAYVTILASNQTMDILLCSSKIEKKKKELAKKYEKELKAGNLITVEQMEAELISYSKEVLKGDPALDMFDSGVGGTYENNFKNMYIMKGAMKDPDPDKGYNVALSNYRDGISKDEYAMVANSLAAGPYSRGKKTQVGGYLEKLLLSAYQHVVLDEAGSDCGTKRTVTVTLTGSNVNAWMYSYIVDGGRLIELTSKNKDKYIGRTVKFRFSSMCESPNICNKCAGNLYYRLGIRNVGSTTPQVASKLKNIAMKAFHDSVPVLSEMDPMKAFGLE